MAVLERIWELIGAICAGILSSVERTVTSIFGSSNARTVHRMRSRVERISAMEPQMQSLSDEQLRGKTEQFRARLKNGETLDDILEEAFAVCREAGQRFLGMRHYDVQLIGGMVLHSGSIAEMVTGEGKTLVATLPAYLNALEGKGVHVITVNDYLARRDMEWMAPLYMNLGLTVGAIQSGMSTAEKQHAYARDITYGTNNEFGFDYLRDNMRPAARGDDRFPKEAQQSQGPLHYAIIDEVDNILIDEARTPLIISGPADMDLGKYADADRVARHLTKEKHFTVDEKNHNVTLTDEGVREAERLAGVESFYTAGNMEWPHLIDNALKAHHIYKLDVNYVIKEGQIVIVDEFTGRLMDGRQWSDGLHQAVEAKEGVKIKQETQTFATITLQNFFKLYKKLAGMTGTAMTEANEFWKIYKLDVIAIPTNRSLQRIENPDVIYLSERDKFRALAEDIERTSKWDILALKDGKELWGRLEREDDQNYFFVLKGNKEKQAVLKSQVVGLQRCGRPVLVGTVSIEKSERLSALLDQRGIKHEVLNAKQHQREAEIVAQAGRIGAVTIATNMAGRGTDIILGGNPETMAWAQLQHQYPTRLEVPDEQWNALVEQIDQREKMSEEGKVVRQLGGLMVLGTERHESRRIDLQLRGRCGRQGDPGESRFYLSLEDDLMRIFAGDFVKRMMEKMGMKEGEAIESSLVTRRIAAAQKKVEERNFEIRKNLLEYDEVMDEQRKRVYGYRQRILDGVSCRTLIIDQVENQLRKTAGTLLDNDYGPSSFAAWASGRLLCQLDAKDFRNTDFETACEYAREVAQRAGEAIIYETVEENLPSDGDPEEWNYQAMATWANKRYETNYRDRDIRQMDREEFVDTLIAKAQKKVEDVDLSAGRQFLEADFGRRSLATWLKNKFGIDVSAETFKDREREEIVGSLLQLAQDAYMRKETEYPAMTGISAFTFAQGAQLHLDREGLARWIHGRFGVELPAEAIRTSHRELMDQLVALSQVAVDQAVEVQKTAAEKLSQIFQDRDGRDSIAAIAGSNGALDHLTDWLHSELGCRLPKDEIGNMDREQLMNVVDGAVDDRFFPEMRRMERQVLLSIVDNAWKDHLLAMDHLRSSVGLKGYAQMDPKVEYKREGMRLFEQMWDSIGERTTDLVFRMESFNEDFVRSTWVDARARHDEIAPATRIDGPQSRPAGPADGATNRDQAPQRVEPVRRSGPRVGRNDPCPCGSGKKFKNCCMNQSSEI